MTSNSSATFQLRQAQQEPSALPNSVFHIQKGREWGFGFSAGFYKLSLEIRRISAVAKSQVPGEVARSHLEDRGSLQVANSSCQ